MQGKHFYKTIDGMIYSHNWDHDWDKAWKQVPFYIDSNGTMTYITINANGRRVIKTKYVGAALSDKEIDRISLELDLEVCPYEEA